MPPPVSGFVATQEPRFRENMAGSPSREFCMNAGPTIKEALIVERIKRWFCRAHYSTQCPKWRARKNFWFLVRKYPALAQRHGFRETSVL